MQSFLSKFLRWVGTLFAILFGLGLLALASLYYITEEKMNRVYEVQASPVEVPSDPQAIERGKHIMETRGQCADCHGENYGGQVFDEGFLMVRLVVPNLTSGKGGIGKVFTDEDWVRAVRYGLKPNGKSVRGMPSEFYYNLSDADLGDLIAYIKSLPPVDNELPKTTVGPMGRLLILQEPVILPAQVIDHIGPHPASPEPGVTAEYGEYLAKVCTMCHDPDFSGNGQISGGVNLTPAGNLEKWTEADFIRALRTGITPEGKSLDPMQMPWKSLGKMTDDELKAIWLFLQALPPIESKSTPVPAQ